MQLTETINHCTNVKNSQVPLIDYLRQESPKLATKISNCSSYLLFQEWHWYENKVTLKSGNFCKNHKLCRGCAIRRAAKSSNSAELKVKSLQLDPRYKGLYVTMLTFTILNREDLLEAFYHLTLNFRRMWKNSRLELKRGMRSAMCCIKGMISSIEIKRGSGSGLWHPHMHILVLSEGMPNQSELRKEWKKFTGDSQSVDVAPIKDLRSGIVEVLKYIVKFSEAAPSEVYEIAKAMHKKTLLNSYGILRGVELNPNLEDDPLDGDYTEYVASYDKIVRGYHVRKSIDI